VTVSDVPVRSLLGAGDLAERASRIASQVDVAEVVPVDAPVGGGSGPGVLRPSVAVSLPESYAGPLRSGDPAVLGRLHRGRLLLDLRAIPADRDDDLLAAVLAVS
jgi:L-seryl-tRNA(Ser) seleniumtransferase